MNKKIIGAMAAAVLMGCGASAAEYKVSSPAEIKKLDISAGDEIVLAAGEWKDVKIAFSAKGTQDSPVTVRSEAPGATVITGDSRFSFDGEYIIVKDLLFKGITTRGGSLISFRTSEANMASHCTLTSCVVDNSNCPMYEDDLKWVSIFGYENTVSNCTLLDKNSMGTTLVIWPEEGVDKPCGHIVEGNYFTRPRSFKDAKGSSRNGQETIRIGTSQVSMQTVGSIVRNNLFYRCNGETECISNKSCGNLYEGNSFVECQGTLTIRHGKACTVRSNIFLGNGMENTGGIRLIDSDHVVTDNILKDLTGRGFYAAISLIQGEPNSAINGYFPAKNCLVARNVVIDCAQGLNVNHKSTRCQLNISDCSLEDNVIANYNGDPKTVENIKVGLEPQPPVDLKWKGNISWNGKVKGMEPEESEVEKRDPMTIAELKLSKRIAKAKALDSKSCGALWYVKTKAKKK